MDTETKCGEHMVLRGDRNASVTGTLAPPGGVLELAWTNYICFNFNSEIWKQTKSMEVDQDGCKPGKEDI